MLKTSPQNNSLMFIIDTEKIIEVFCFIDNFCKEVELFYATHPLKDYISEIAGEEGLLYQKMRCLPC